MPTDVKEVFKDINVNVDTSHAVDIALIWFGYKLIVIVIAIIGLIVLGLFLWWFIRQYGSGPNNLPQAPTGQN